MGAIRRSLGRIFINADKDDTPEAIEQQWREAFMHDAAIRAANYERVELLEALQGIEPEQAKRIYMKACNFMGFGVSAAVLLAQGLDGMTATPDEPTEEAVEAKLEAIVCAMPHRHGVHNGHIAAMIDRKTRNWLMRRCNDLDRQLYGDPPKRYPAPLTPPPIPLELALTDEERRRLDFLRWRVLRREITE